MKARWPAAAASRGKWGAMKGTIAPWARRMPASWRYAFM
jgi:hypothetical protein